MEVVFDIEERLKVHFPILFELLNKNKINWVRVNKVFANNDCSNKQREKSSDSTLFIEPSFYNIVALAIHGESSAIRLLDYIQKTFEELTDRLDETERKEIKDTLFHFLTNMDLKFLNFLGELSVLNLYKRNTGFKLVKTEEPVSSRKKNGVKVDFKFLNENDGSYRYVEVVNLHLKKEKVSSDEQIQRMLEEKFHKKINSTCIKEHPDVFLVPVIWGEWQEIRLIIKYYETTRPSFFNTSMPVCFMTFSDSACNRLHEFGSISSILTGIDIQSDQ